MFQNETTALHVACMDNHQAEDSVLLCDLLIKAGAKVDAIDVDGHTPLHFCCLYGLSDSAKILVRIYQGYLLHTTYKHKMLHSLLRLCDFSFPGKLAETEIRVNGK